MTSCPIRKRRGPAGDLRLGEAPVREEVVKETEPSRLNRAGL
jgi:hypothetical protein